MICAWFEAVQIAGFTVEEANGFFIAPPQGVEVTIDPLPVVGAEALFLARFGELDRSVEGVTLPQSPPRMRSPVHLAQLRRIHRRIALRRGQARMAQQLLDRPQIPAARQQVRGETVA